MATIILQRTVASAWRAPLVALALAIAAVLLLFARDVGDMAAIWWNVSTYQHCLFVLPIIAWLLWQRSDEVAPTLPVGWPPGLALVLGGGIVWLLGEAGGVALVRHIGVVAMVQASVVAILGPAVARAILFPLFYLVFLVPFGDEFVGPMQTLTAKMTMALLGATNIAASIDGVFITTRAGWFEVAEACAGVKFLVAMVAYATLAANLCFRSTLRRAAFMAFACVVPVLANGVRAWGTIFAADFIGVERATGLDHLIYGWVFFAVVMLAIMAAAYRFFDRRIGDDWLGGRVFSPWRPTAPVLMMAPLAIAATALPVMWDAVAAGSGRIALTGRIDLPGVAGWTRVRDLPPVAWVPRFDGADHRLYGRYGDAGSARVDIAVALYGWQEHGREIVGFGQGAAPGWTWAADLPPLAGGRAGRILAARGTPRETVTFWIVGGRAYASPARVKLATLATRLAGDDQSAATIIVSGERAALARFLAAFGDPAARGDAMLGSASGR